MQKLTALHKRALTVTLTSLLLWTGWNYGRDLCHPFADLSCGFFTDQFTHVTLTRIFTEVGAEIYLTPRGELAEPMTDAEKAVLPPDVQTFGDPRSVEGWPRDKPFIATWTEIPSFYPPADLLLFAPASAIYSFTDISFTESNRLTIQLLLVYAHVSIYLILVASMARTRTHPERILAIVFAYAMVIHWTLEGFYDGAWIAPLVLTPVFLVKRDPVPALLTFSMGAFAHFRSLFYLPWAAEGAYRFVADHQWRPWTKRKAIALGATGVMGAASLATFLVVLNAMTSHRMTNQFNPRFDVFDLSSLLSLLVILLPGCAVFAYQRVWRELIMLLWVGGLIVMLPEINQWEAIALVPWMLAPVDELDTRGSVVEATRVATVILVIGIVFPQSIQVEWIHTAIGQLVGQ